MSFDSDQVLESLISEFLERKGYEKTFSLFQEERSSSVDSDLHGLVLDKLVQDRLDYIAKYEQDQAKKDPLVVNDLIENKDLFDYWEEEETVPKNWNALNINNSLVIHLSSGIFKFKNELKDVLFVSLSNKELVLVDLKTREELIRFKDIHKGVLGKLCYCIPNTNLILNCNMNGDLKLFEVDNDLKVNKLCELKIHKRLVIDFRIFHDLTSDEYLIFSIGWDFYLNLTKLTKKDDTYELLSLSGLKLTSLPNSIELGTYNDSTPLLFLTRQDSTRLAIYTTINVNLVEITRISLNDSQFSSNEFTAMSISLSNIKFNDDDNRPMIGITTSHVPFLRVLIIKPPNFKELLKDLSVDNKPTDLYNQLIGNFNTLSPQDKYSQPTLQWTLDDDKVNGCWIPGDDGIIRGLKFKDGKVFQLLGLLNDSGDQYVKLSYKDEENKAESVHSGQRIKCFVNHKKDGKEVLVTSGIDKKLVVWT